MFYNHAHVVLIMIVKIVIISCLGNFFSRASTKITLEQVVDRSNKISCKFDEFFGNDLSEVPYFQTVSAENIHKFATKIEKKNFPRKYAKLVNAAIMEHEAAHGQNIQAPSMFAINSMNKMIIEILEMRNY